MNRHRTTRSFSLMFLSAALFLFGGRLSADQIETFRSAGGEMFFAVPLTTDGQAPTGPVNAALAVDLSAGQLSAQVRAEARRAAAAFIAGLAEGSRVQVFVASNRLVPLPATAEFEGETYTDTVEKTIPALDDVLCKWCGQRHEGFFGKILGFFHNIAYFFAHLFGRR